MSFARRVGRNRPAVTFLLATALCVVSIASGTEASGIGRAVNGAVTSVAHPFLVAFNRVSGGASHVSNLVANYDAAVSEAEVLRQELAAAERRLWDLEEAASENVRLQAMLEFQEHTPRMTLLPARVIGTPKYGVVQIDRGSAHGIVPQSCAITREGVVGRIHVVHPYQSTVHLLYHPDSKIGVRVQRTRVDGWIVQGAKDPRNALCEMVYLGANDDVKKGDFVVTSIGSIFPSGWPVGRVAALEGTGSLQRTAQIQPAANLNALDELFVVLSARPPQDAIEGPAAPKPEAPEPEADAAKRAYPVPDVRSLQERLAP